MRAVEKTDRLGLLLALLLVLLGVSAGVAPNTDGGTAGPPPRPRPGAAVLGESASASPSMSDDLHDWLRLSMAARSAPNTAVPETWWAAHSPVPGARTRPGPPTAREVDRTGTGAGEPTPQSSRAPPTA
ncbi:hypothetical protein IOD16_22800 [Saccharothrix sp. 6-C]|uniref:hypothetical protein n=1 Tax=Saccharothrix sp. 6-C TaxID=2781735 RepID=UPI0019176325|nr:hypothetical protein [Saccharothrix sp. 6-C]QQQ74052.1 hypothetical protein IOD16_22800 [Saccharothrix sp. 6-C]